MIDFKLMFTNPTEYWKFFVALIGALVQIFLLWNLITSETGSKITETLVFITPLVTAYAVMLKGNIPKKDTT